jgi:hypothetical protein
MTSEEIKLLSAKARAFRAEAFRHTGLIRLGYLRLAQAFLNLARAHTRIDANDKEAGPRRFPTEDGSPAAWPRS